MLYLVQLILGIMLIAIGIQQEFLAYGAGSVALGIAFLTPLSWWRRKDGG